VSKPKPGRKKMGEASSAAKQKEPSSALAKKPREPKEAKEKKKKADKPASVPMKKAREPKEAKEKKDPNAPKKARSSYMLYSMSARKDACYEGLAFGEVGKALGAKWKELSEEEKGVWAEEAKKDKERYEREMALYDGPAASTSAAKKSAAPKPKAAPKPPKAAASASAAETKPRRGGKLSKKAALPEPDSSGDEAEADSTELCLTSGAPLMDDPSVQELLLPRAKKPMRSSKLRVGDEVVWFPQCFTELQAHYASQLEKVDLSADVPGSESTLIVDPQDGTGNAAVVEAIDPLTPPIKGWHLLRLRAIEMDGSESEQETRYSLPYVERRYCDVDHILCERAHYLQSLERWGPSCEAGTHAVVRFAADAAGREEEEWEGRVWDLDVQDTEYPRSTYRALRCLWYQQVKSSVPGGQWVIDPEQTDCEVSPWEAEPSAPHLRWKEKFPELADSLPSLRPDRETLTKLVMPSGSCEITDAAEMTDVRAVLDDTLERMMKRLLSTEVTSIFRDPVPLSEKAYHEKISQPICLSEMDAKRKAGGYASVADFIEDFGLMISNAMTFNKHDTLPFMAAHVLQKDFNIAMEAVKEHRPALME